MGASEIPSWKPSNSEYTIRDYSYCKVWVRKVDQMEYLEEYSVSINNQSQLTNYQNMFSRRLNHKHFVATLYFTHQPGNICGAYETGSILLERIPYRLCKFSNIPYSESLSILNQALISYQMLSASYGLFKPGSTMIGLNKKFQLKIWHHTDFSQQQPENPYCSSEQQMIFSLLSSIEKISENKLPPKYSFRSFLSGKLERISFKTVIQSLQEYCRKYNHPLSRNSFPQLQRFYEEIENLEQFLIFENQQNYMRKLDRSSRYHEKQREVKSLSKNKFSFKNNSLMKDEKKKHVYGNSIAKSSKLQEFENLSLKAKINQEELIRQNQKIKLLKHRLEKTTNLVYYNSEKNPHEKSAKDPLRQCAYSSEYGISSKFVKTQNCQQRKFGKETQRNIYSEYFQMEKVNPHKRLSKQTSMRVKNFEQTRIKNEELQSTQSHSRTDDSKDRILFRKRNQMERNLKILSS